MHIFAITGIALALALQCSSAVAQDAGSGTYARVSLPETEVRNLHSAIIGDEFQLFVALPRGYSTNDTTYPVLYMTDANMLFAAATQVLRFMQLPGPEALPQILLVGIGYRTETVRGWRELRNRDLTPARAPDPTNVTRGGAANFLRFIREELKPFISKNYRVSGEAGYAGGSYGGLFGLYALFHEPGTFQKYLLLSPSIAYDSLVTFEYEAEYAARHADLPVQLFLCAGGLEQEPGRGHGMITDMKQMMERLRGRRYPGLHLESTTLEGETHRSVPAPAISRGLRVLYGR